MSSNDIQESNQGVTSNAKTTEDLIEEINSNIQQLRAAIFDPVVIRYSDRVFLEIRPKEDGEAVMVCCDGMGETTVDYMPQGLVLRVWPDFDSVGELDPFFETAFEAQDLQGEPR